MTTIREDGKVEFKFFRPSATIVRLAGDFCEWLSGAISMKPVGNGWWSTVLNLPSGEYRFRYVADGVWYTDFASHGIENCKLGWNSVLLVPVKESLVMEQTYSVERTFKTQVKSAAA